MAGSITSGKIIGTAVLLAVFVGALALLKTVPSDDDADSVKRDVQTVIKASAEQARKDAEKAATAAKPSYDFYRLLEKQTVEVPQVSEYKSTPKGAETEYEYRLQAGSFRSASDADRMRAGLILSGLPAYTESSSVNDSTWHRVFVGPYTNRSRMNKAQDVLASQNISPLVLKQKREQ